ncbi:hypothetical protein D9V32_05165 [Mycetocola tolaasinivorans]|uniref:N-formylglutamate amidohydrolase n=1 Tax=Mycetocola tolaasinivorans TaxID=76635 RepID=A0A3L7A9Z6_9MICO|nr:N-formylglutamate amidohydrolase [Mycetocola tolaasinivorans]RLP77017.1 hypothetical protein D9V32_05165 [Mycetocola tolaasinivorans]
MTSRDAAPVLIPEGTVYTAEDITFWANPERRSLDQAIAEADVLVSCPHSGAAIPAEISPYLAPEFTRRLQYDFSDVATSAIVRRWAEIDPRIVYVENPHPRLIRDPNRAKPEDPAALLAEAIERVRAAGPYQRVDLTGVDAIRPVTFSFYPLLRVPDTAAELSELTHTFARVAEQGLGVYERTRDDLTERFIAAAYARAAREGQARFTRLSFHDTMNTTTTREGAVNVAREAKDRLPRIVALSNRGDHAGNPRPEGPVTMDPVRIRVLAAAHREAFATELPEDVALNQPYLGSQEIIAAGERFTREYDAPDAGVHLDAVQAEFLREFLLGNAAVSVLHEPGEGWITEDPDHIDAVAHACRDAWDRYRSA